MTVKKAPVNQDIGHRVDGISNQVGEQTPGFDNPEPVTAIAQPLSFLSVSALAPGFISSIGTRWTIPPASAT
jgi:hypothetical protein